ncbi:hypothetical protein P153DRAFT_433982 [Dothidotthia symphoricarpi CBS 119687]|uniref:Uncharacterized protein n=1 Tax=Dothidotthia symphoricarpi CBS 119687 TaxID=1392245 RepID=A0A6A6A4V0_9PLEO|nr:uncharacterized protein P153DRAFT_433982 [Dothidotthia symphoricarpi CBS 119687]KAF2126195.1 hypothetical protein P153DRAFT_433982 [Dothidotthia symphoricarpi CBS 119687]
MVENLANHINLSEEAVRPELPQLRLELDASKTLSLTLPYEIRFLIKRSDGPADKPVIFEWNQYDQGLRKSALVLLRHTANNLEAIAIDHSGLGDLSRHEPLVVNSHSHDLWELAPRGTVTSKVTLPERYQKLLKSGETYTLLWPGGDIGTWDYGTVREHIGQELKDNAHALVLAGGPHVTFTAHVESQPWPMRLTREARVGLDRANLEEQRWRRSQNQTKDTFPPAKHIDRDPDAPNLSVLLECPSSFRQDILFEVTVKVTYHAEATARPIIFHTRIFNDIHWYQVGRLCNGTWEGYDNGKSGCCGFLIVDDPDVPVNVSQNDRFASLQPGQSWTTTRRVGYNGIEIPDDAKNGETFRFVFTGELLDWWNWGSKADHEDTVVMLPCFLWGPVVNPKDNDGRPKLFVPTSNVVEFTFVE